MAGLLSGFGEAIYSGKGIRPKSGQPLIRPEWLGAAPEERPYDASAPQPQLPTVSSSRPAPLPIDDATKDNRDWDIVTPPSSPTHLHELCAIAGISIKKEIDKYPILPPPDEPVVPFRAFGEQVCVARLRQFEEMENQRLGIPLSGSNLLDEVHKSCDWNVVERIVFDQRKWERDEVTRTRELRANLKVKDAEAGGKAARQTNELVLLEVVEDFDMDVGSDGVVTSCELDCHITAETHLTSQRTLSMWLDKLFLLEECKLHPRIDQQAFRAEQVLRFLPDKDHVVELCNFKVLRSVMSCIVPPLIIKPHFMFDDHSVCTIHITATVCEGHGENVDIIFPMPESMINSPVFSTSGDASTAVFGNTTKLCRWQIPRLEKNATLEGTVALYPTVPLPTDGPTLKAKFEVVGLNVCGVSVAAVEADSELQPRLVLRHVVRSVDSTIESTVGRLRKETVGFAGDRPLFAM